jgi:predicted unusual protein kinase regulating ubiquinone biosynthesis (AarF/ABC1/UbiB family)
MTNAISAHVSGSIHLFVSRLSGLDKRRAPRETALPMAQKKVQSRIKSGAISRSVALARMSAQAGARAAGHLVGNLFASDSERPERLKSLLKAQATVLARELGQLKGSVMKVGQMLSVYGEKFFPDEVNAVLKTLQNQSPPLEWKAIEPILRKHLGQERFEQLEIEQDALASASLGQVHLARVRPGSPLALQLPAFARDLKLAIKVQYPGIDRSIDSDLATLRSILSVSKLLPKASSDGYQNLFKEVSQMLHQETDYARELDATAAFRQLLEDDSRLVVPRVVPELSTPRVLVTEYLDGLPVDSPEVKGLSQERRNALGLAILELLFRELYQLHQVQTDPHFGNYRIQLGKGGEPDRIVLLDFGAVRKFPKSFLVPYFELHRGAFVRDPALIERGGRGLGFLSEDDPPAVTQAFAELCYLIGEPFDGGIYDWAASDLATRVAKSAAQVALAFKLRAPPREIVFLDRKFGGLFVFLSVLGARVDARPVLERYLMPTAEIRKTS